MQEAALAGAWFGFLQGVLFVITIPRMGPIQPNEQISAVLINVVMIVMGMFVGAGMAAFTAYLAERRRAT